MRDFAAYVFYVNRPDLLRRAIDCFSDLWEDLTVVDNSGGDGRDCYCPSTVERFLPPVPLTYSQSMNWMLKDALEKKVDFIIHFHSDAVSTNPIAVHELLKYGRQLNGSGLNRWGCLWTYYDILWAINPKAVKDIGGWDTEFTAYFTDNDVRRRLELRGWECIDTHIDGIDHEGSATINSDPELQFKNGITFPLRRHYYVQKWGGEPGKETFLTPFNK